jgi:ABC-2 type transport system ATP-binding protein
MEIISINNFSKNFGRKKAVNDLSFDVNQGDVFAFLGSNGSGKTTTIRCLLDIYQPDKGVLLINGKKYTHKMNKFIGYLPEERGIYTRAVVEELFLYFASLRGIKSEESKKLAKDYLERVGLIESKDKKVNQLSSGMQQKVQIGLTILHKPELLILDEPFRGLDPVNRQLFIEIFQELNKAGTTIMYSSHMIDEVQRLANRLVIINKGERQAYGTINEVRSSFGTNNIQVEFKGSLPENTKLYKARITQNTAEISPNSDVKTNEILSYLVKSDIEILDYSVDYPSLNEVFINIVQTKEV